MHYNIATAALSDMLAEVKIEIEAGGPGQHSAGARQKRDNDDEVIRFLVRRTSTSLTTE